MDYLDGKYEPDGWRDTNCDLVGSQSTFEIPDSIIKKLETGESNENKIILAGKLSPWNDLFCISVGVSSLRYDTCMNDVLGLIIADEWNGYG